MRKRQTFLLTILSEDNVKGSLCGRVKAISTGKTCNFTNLNELNQLIAAEMETDVSHADGRAEDAKPDPDQRVLST